MKQQIIDIILNVRPDFEYDADVKLISDGFLDSFDMISLILDLNEHFDVQIGAEDVNEEQFDTVDAIESLIQEKLD